MLTFANLNTPKLNKLSIKECNAINYNFCNRKYLHKRNYLSMISSYSNLKYDDYDFNNHINWNNYKKLKIDYDIHSNIEILTNEFNQLFK